MADEKRKLPNLKVCKQGLYHIERELNNQDYAVDVQDVISVVMDGCSNCKHSDVGVKLFGHFVETNIRNPEEFNDDFLDRAFKEIMNGLYFKKERTEEEMQRITNYLVMNYLLFTILSVSYDEKTDEFVIKYIGDGYIILVDHKDKITYANLDVGEYPPYFAYRYLKKTDDVEIKKNEDLEKRSNNLKILKFRGETYKYVGVSTDGMRFILELGQSEDKEKNNLYDSCSDAMKRLLPGKLMRTINLLKTPDRPIVQDDIAVVLLSRPERLNELSKPVPVYQPVVKQSPQESSFKKLVHAFIPPKQENQKPEPAKTGIQANPNFGQRIGFQTNPTKPSSPVTPSTPAKPSSHITASTPAPSVKPIEEKNEGEMTLVEKIEENSEKVLLDVKNLIGYEDDKIHTPTSTKGIGNSGRASQTPEIGRGSVIYKPNTVQEKNKSKLTIESIFIDIKTIFKDLSLIPNREITIDSIFDKDLKFNETDVFRLITRVERFYKISLVNSKIRKCSSVKTLSEAILAKLFQKVKWNGETKK